jgi:hypothetical protein
MILSCCVGSGLNNKKAGSVFTGYSPAFFIFKTDEFKPLKQTRFQVKAEIKNQVVQ